MPIHPSRSREPETSTSIPSNRHALSFAPAFGDIEQREKELRDFVENAAVALHRVGEDGTILWANRAEMTLLGYTPEEYIGHNIAEFHVDAAVIEDILCRLKKGQALEGCQARLRCKDGSIRYVLINSSVYREEGRFVHTRCVTLDITDQKKDFEAYERLAAIVESSDDAILSKDLRGIIREMDRLFPGLGEHLEEETTVAIDGAIHETGYFQHRDRSKLEAEMVTWIRAIATSLLSRDAAGWSGVAVSLPASSPHYEVEGAFGDAAVGRVNFYWTIRY